MLGDVNVVVGVMRISLIDLQDLPNIVATLMSSLALLIALRFPA